MYKNIHNFIPFQHENADTKNNLINLAREQDSAKAEGALTATLIYANLVDYLARHLLQNLREMLSLYTFKQLGGIFHLDFSKERDGLPLNELQRGLRVFIFPGKEDFLDSLEEFKKLRNQAMHNLMLLDPNDTTGKIDKDLAKIKDLAEDLLLKYNIIVNGLSAIWSTAYTGPAPAASEDPVRQ